MAEACTTWPGGDAHEQRPRVPTTRSWRSGSEAALCGDETDMADDTRQEVICP